VQGRRNLTPKALLCYVDVNSNYGFAAAFASFDGERVRAHETLKLRPPNRERRLKEAAERGAPPRTAATLT